MQQLIKSNSKRLRISIIAFFIYIIIGILTLFIDSKALTGMGVYIGSTSLPILVYILGESFRPSNKTNTNGTEH